MSPKINWTRFQTLLNIVSLHSKSSVEQTIFNEKTNAKYIKTSGNTTVIKTGKMSIPSKATSQPLGVKKMYGMT